MTDLTRDDRDAASSALGAELSHVVARLRRVLRRSVRRGVVDPLAPAASEVLVFVAEHPGAGVTEVADGLRLAPNTVSTLVGQLVEAGLLKRTTDPADRRAVRLDTTGAARARIARYRANRAATLDRALDRLDPAERDLLSAAVPVMRCLGDSLEAEAAATYERAGR
jgi:DNA-binding MarR family transcriptional regulator